MSKQATPDPESAFDQLCTFIQANRPLFVLTGAGCSTASGIPDYRDDEGQWKFSKPVQFTDFVNSESVRKRYWARSMIGWQRVENAKPNAAHHALNQLQQLGLIQALVTQNVDGLHQRAGGRALDLHGRLEKVLCLQCKSIRPRSDVQKLLLRHNPSFSGGTDRPAPDGDAIPVNEDYGSFIIPDCEICGGLLKPDVVFFGESVPKERVTQARQHLDKAQAVLVVGSSLMVYSGYRFIKAAIKQQKPVVAINQGKTRADPELTLKFNQPCGPLLSRTAAWISSSLG